MLEKTKNYDDDNRLKKKHFDEAAANGVYKGYEKRITPAIRSNDPEIMSIENDFTPVEVDDDNVEVIFKPNDKKIIDLDEWKKKIEHKKRFEKLITYGVIFCGLLYGSFQINKKDSYNSSNTEIISRVYASNNEDKTELNTRTYENSLEENAEITLTDTTKNSFHESNQHNTHITKKIEKKETCEQLVNQLIECTSMDKAISIVKQIKKDYPKEYKKRCTQKNGKFIEPEIISGVKITHYSNEILSDFCADGSKFVAGYHSATNPGYMGDIVYTKKHGLSVAADRTDQDCLNFDVSLKNDAQATIAGTRPDDVFDLGDNFLTHDEKYRVYQIKKEWAKGIEIVTVKTDYGSKQVLKYPIDYK